MSVVTREQAEKNKKNLRGANLDGADLYRADLNGANLNGANLNGANLYRANLDGANLYRANLYRANLYRANLSGANLSGANLSEANLREADLRKADLREAKLPYFQIPQEGELIVWKKLSDSRLCKLRIPSSAKRTANLINGKCRAEYAEVLEIVDDGGISRSSASGIYNPSFKYTVGTPVYADKYDPDIRIDCSGGIHFFLTKEEAKDYY